MDMNRVRRDRNYYTCIGVSCDSLAFGLNRSLPRQHIMIQLRGSWVGRQYIFLPLLQNKHYISLWNFEFWSPLSSAKRLYFANMIYVLGSFLLSAALVEEVTVVSCLTFHHLHFRTWRTSLITCTIKIKSKRRRNIKIKWYLPSLQRHQYLIITEQYLKFSHSK